MCLEIDERRPIYRQIMEAFIRQIACGRWSPGEKLPAIREVATKINVNSNTVARAFQELERTGLTEARRGEGTFVTNNLEKIKAWRDKTAMELWDEFFTKMSELGFSDQEIVCFVSKLKGDRFNG